MDELIYASATALARSIKNKDVSSLELINAYLARIEAVNPRINAVTQLSSDDARQAGRDADLALARGEVKGPLHGVPFTVKDSLDTSGVISTAGTKGRAGYVPEQDATVVVRLRAAGGILLGKTNTPELTLAGETDNFVYGRTNNPYDVSRTPAGSSGGAAAIIAAGGSPLDLGTDTGGSIRMPSHFCGIAGIKPTSGRVPRTGHIISFDMGALDSLTQIGPMARFVEDLILTLPIIAGVDGCDPAIIPMPLGDPRSIELKGLRVAFYTDNGIVTPTPATVDVVYAAVTALTDAGLRVTEDRPPGLAGTTAMWRQLFLADGGATVRRLLRDAGTTEMHPLSKWTQEEEAVSGAECAELLAQWEIWRGTMLGFLESYDVIISPVCAGPALPHGGTDRYTFSYTKPYNLAGWPAAVVRGGTSPEGLPIGIQIVGRPWREDVLLAVAGLLERMLGGWQPPLL